LFNKKIPLPLAEVRYFESIGSTNDEALAWAAKGAEDLSLVIADEQTAGRGRLNRTWFTPKGTALAMSLILRPTGGTPLSRTVGLAALSVADSLLKRSLAPRIKWPNDILLNGKKVAGILVEAVWAGTEVESLVIGMGVNVTSGSVPPGEDLRFPATSVEDELGQPVDRAALAEDILSALLQRRAQMDTQDFMQAWEEMLAFRGEKVLIRSTDKDQLEGRLIGLGPDGSLKLHIETGEDVQVNVGEVSLRPAP
jgi:BirA family biotin operon repressor/biotin-[acetyl-CoA-carboxylase] ligase